RWCNGFVAYTHDTNSAHSDIAIDAIAIPDEVARRLIPRECFRDLVRDPFCCWIGCNIDPDEVSAVESNNDEGIEQIEANGRHNEQIHGRDVRRVITQEGTPSLAWRPTPLDHVLGNARLRHLKPELKQLTMNARRSPKRVLNAHPPDQRAQIRLDLRAPSSRTRLPAPIAAKTHLMPPDERLRTDDRKNVQD